MKFINNNNLIKEMYSALERSVAVYDLLHAHARGETDLTEEQLANVVTTISLEAKDTLAKARGRVTVGLRMCAYRAVASRRRRGPVRPRTARQPLHS